MPLCASCLFSHPSRLWRTASLVGLAAAAVAAQAATGLREGAYADALGSTPVVCVTAQQAASLGARAWKTAMQQRGMECSVSDAAQPLPGLESWKASCANPAPGSASGPWLYQFTVRATPEQLLIDSRMTTAAGELAMKKAFDGTYQGACAAGMPTLDVWAYLDGAHGATTQGDAGARKAVAMDLIRCGNVFNGLSLTVAKARQEGMRSAAASLISAAVALHPADTEFHSDALKKSAPEVSAELVGASAEKKLALYQSCSPYLEPEGVARAVKNHRSAGAAAP